MKMTTQTRRLTGIALFSLTAVSVACFPLLQSAGASSQNPPVNAHITTIAPEHPAIEVVFALDTTGSMAGLIEAAKEKIWSIAHTMASAQNAPRIKMGLVAYRDRGDAYVTQVTDLSRDLDSVYAKLMDFRAQGGGDGPESVNQALHDAVTRMSWSQDQSTYRVVFLVGDAPPHMDYNNDVHYPVTAAEAKRRGIVINAIQAGQQAETKRHWQQIAALGAGDFFDVAQDGSAVAVATPFDDRLAKLSKELDATRLYYGDEEERVKFEKKKAATEKLHGLASTASRARRAEFNLSESGRSNLLGDKDLVGAVASGEVNLSEIESENLPASIRTLAPAEQAAVLEETAQKRDALEQEMHSLANERRQFIQKKVEDEGGARESLDAKLYRSIQAQAAGKGLRYDAAAPSY